MFQSVGDFSVSFRVVGVPVIDSVIDYHRVCPHVSDPCFCSDELQQVAANFRKRGTPVKTVPMESDQESPTAKTH